MEGSFAILVAETVLKHSLYFKASLKSPWKQPFHQNLHPSFSDFKTGLSDSRRMFRRSTASRGEQSYANFQASYAGRGDLRMGVALPCSRPAKHGPESAELWRDGGLRVRFQPIHKRWSESDSGLCCEFARPTYASRRIAFRRRRNLHGGQRLLPHGDQWNTNRYRFLSNRIRRGT